MSNVSISAQGLNLPEWTNEAGVFASKVMNELKRDNWELSILFCDDKKITELNSQYRSKNEPTDILSFRLDEPPYAGKNDSTVYPGDIIISLDTLRENSLYFNVGQDEELRRLIIHGILHLDGMDHATNDKNEPMLTLQEKILDKFKNDYIIPDTSSEASRGSSSAAPRGISSAASRGGKK